jgi:restriction endonuclease
MKNIRFDEQPFQLSAINAIADIFDGQYAADSQKLFEIQAKFAQDDSLLAGLTQDFTIRGNSIQVSDEMLVKNIREIQERNGIESPSAAESFKHGRNYTIEMETGTGKTYVYLRMVDLFEGQDQNASKMIAGNNVIVRNNFTLHAATADTVQFRTVRRKAFSGLGTRSTEVSVVASS